MKKQLLLLRQGSSQPLPGLGGEVHDLKNRQDSKKYGKELSDKGKRRAQRMGVWIARMELQPDLILCSSSPVARVTAEKSAKSMGLGTQDISVNRWLDKSGSTDWMKLFTGLSANKQRIMVVGGKAVAGGLLKHLVPDTPAQKLLLKPASLAVFSCAESWQQVAGSNARLRQIVHARTLPEGFPFPDINSSEQRIRPAYYYQQSSVIPYRIEQGKVRILLVSSSKMKHWVVPKGIHEPGLTAAESAAKEAYEEAGVEGLIGAEPIGHYEYQKWEGTCQVVVFPMRVQRVIAEQDWEESHRGRRWMMADAAAALVRQRELAPLILGLAKQVGVS